MLTRDHVVATFPGVYSIRDERSRELVFEVWRYVSDRNRSWSDIARVPLHPTMPIETHGNLVKHVVAMARIAERVVTMYQDLWDQDVDPDVFRTAAYVHDAAKVIEFTETPRGLVAIPGYNHAIEAGRIVREVGGPETIAHMSEAHSFTGPLVMPRTREAQLFLLLDPLCLNVFPEQGTSVMDRHLKANGWTAPDTLGTYRTPR